MDIKKTKNAEWAVNIVIQADKRNAVPSRLPSGISLLTAHV